MAMGNHLPKHSYKLVFTPEAKKCRYLQKCLKQ